jgi:hypothetical protein
MLATLLTPEKSTITNLLCTSARQHQDWTADYRLYSRDRIEQNKLFALIHQTILTQLPALAPLVVSLDDTITRKTGKHIHGSGWKRDPLGPAFQTNLVCAQRYLQLSACYPLGEGQARSIPIDIHHCPSPIKPKANASEAEKQNYREALKQQNLNHQTLQRLNHLRTTTPSERRIILTGDGSYTNKTILNNLPSNTAYIGRTRKDLNLHYLPEPEATTLKGRPASYGKQAPTPEQLRQDPDTPWQIIRAYAAGKHHDFRIKTIDKLLWTKTGAKTKLRLIVIAPLGYRLTKSHKLLYRQPAYLLCTDLDIPVEQLLQNYLWRWGIEVNFREEKTLIGTGQAQVRTASSNQHVPAITVAAYALLWLSALKQIKEKSLSCLGRPKWRKSKNSGELPSTGDLIRLLRYQTWAAALRPSTFYHFANKDQKYAKCQKSKPDLAATLFSAA